MGGTPEADPFAFLDQLPPPPAEPAPLLGGGAPQDPFAARAALFGLEASPATPPPSPAPPAPVVQVEAPAPAAGAAPATALARLSLVRQAPASAPSPVVEAPPPPPLARKLGALVVNVLLGALLLVLVGGVALAGANEGTLPLEALRARGGAPAPVRPLATRDVSNGLYDTRSGRPVFYVRGEVENQGQAPTRVQVRVEVLDGTQRLRTGLGLVGASATPEELAALATPQDGEALRARLDARARTLAPGERAPFLVAFVEYPPELGRYRLQVTAEPAPEGAPR